MFILIKVILHAIMTLPNFEPNTLVRINTKSQSYEGRILPAEGEFIVLKLSSGYNLGINPKNIMSVEKLPEKDFDQQSSSDVSDSSSVIKQNTDLPKLRILHTGGTIASKVDYKTGGVIAEFEPEALIALFPELSDITFVESEFLGNMFSDDFRFSHFNKIAKAVKKAVDEGVKNIIVTSGTDFLHYLSAGLTFMLKDLDVGVMVVGSQRSSDRGSSDAAMNLVCAAQFLATTNFDGVGVCMHENTDDNTCLILPGINTRKMHSSRRDAFKGINTMPLARVNYETKTVNLLEGLNIDDTKNTEKSGELFLLNETLKIGLLYSHPNMSSEEISHYESFDGLVVAGSGLGHLPITKVDDDTKEHEKNASAIESVAKRIPVVMSTQTLYGRVHMNVYSPAKKLREFGIAGHLNPLTPESTYMKLAWLLSNNKDSRNSEKIAEIFEEEINGELSDLRQNEFY